MATSQLLRPLLLFLVSSWLHTTVLGAPPVFDVKYNSIAFSVSENEVSGYVIETLTATDDDATVVYSVQDADGGPFTIANTNELQTNGALDRETKASYTVVLRVTAGPDFTDVTVTIEITDVNDNPPLLTLTDIDQTINEEESVGYDPSFVFSATDNDINEVLTYELSGADSSIFNINYLDGTVTLATQVDVDTTPGTPQLVYSPILTVYDNGKVHSATATLTLTVTDINDNTPVCTNLITYVTLAENSNNGAAAIATLACTDDDGAPNNNNVLAYTIDPANADFSISASGAVTVDTNQDYETTKSITLTIKVADTPTTGILSVTATVYVTVTGENDLNPVWGTISPTPDSTGPSTYNIGEDIAIGTNVFTVVATDADDDIGKDITYSITSVDDGTNPVTGVFTIGPSNGQVTTQTALDRDGLVSSYVISLQATDGGTTSHIITTSVTVTLTDINDIAPQFTSLPTSIITIPETGAITNSVVYTVSASDGDVTATTYTYTVASVVIGNSLVGDWKFSTTIPGQLEFAVDIDLDTIDKAYNVLKVLVSDSVNSATASVSVSITPSDNEFTPTGSLSPVSPVSISEASPVDTSVTTVSGLDSDTGNEGLLSYEIISGNVNDAFTLDPTTLEIKTQKTLDKETLASYSLVVRISDNAATVKSVDIPLVINLLDVNDNPPSCTQLLIPVDLLETSPVGTEVASLSCSDSDGDSLTYAVLAPGDTTFEFASNKLNLKTVVNYDSADQSYLVSATVTDGTFTSTVVISVSLTAANEDTPNFAALPAINLNENNSPPTTLTTYTATDNDYSPHAITSYQITAVTNSGSSLFAIDSSTGEITIVGVLDYEVLPAGDKTYELTILAEDGGGLQGSSTVTLSVDDLNDGSPTCTQALWNIAQDETPTGTGPWTLVASLGCTDPEGATLAYTFTQTSPTAAFGVATDSVTLLTDTLDYETATVHTLTITVSDGALTTEVIVNVNVNNLNDGAPTFSATTPKDLLESVPAGSTVATVSATDPDADDLTFGDPQHSILSGDTLNQFSIDVDTGLITTRKALDYENTQTYNLVIQAQERGGTNSVTVTQVVNVLPVNDNAPTCSPSTLAQTVPENSAVNFVVTSFSCADLDTGTTLTYTITTGDTALFEMSGSDLRLKAQLDFETAQSHDVTVTVSDGDVSHNLAIQGTVTVGSVDEDTPSYATATYNINVNEAEAIGFAVETVSATDSDSTLDSNGIIIYSFVGTYSDFALDSTNGKITLAKQLDRDTTPTTYDLYVRASDATGSDTATVSVVVTDANDNTPVFNPTSYSGTISEADASGHTILSVTATDADDPATNNYGTVRFSLSGTGSSDFAIGAISGEITSAATMNAGTTPSYSLTVTATDSSGGAGALLSTTVVTISVSLANQNAPIFQSTPYARTIAENELNVGDEILTVTATDIDSGVNGDVTLSFSVSQTKFSLVQSGNVGSIRLAQALDFDSGDTSFSITVKATDGATIPSITTETVTITVNDANDNSPLCTSGLNIVKDEGQTAIASLSCTDVDAGTVLTYTIHSTTPNTISPAVSSIGVITVATALDFETDSSYQILVKVVDDGSPVKSTTVTISLFINDLNDNDPTFSGTPFVINVNENVAPSSTVLLSVTANSNDGPTDTVTYSLSDTTYFDVASVTGDITLKANAPDFETVGASMTVDVYADDTANPTSRRATETITVNIADVNDNIPVFNPTVYSGQAAESAATGYSVGQVTATDADTSAAFKSITYSITAGDASTQWRIQANGDVEVNAALDYETTTSYTLTIQASDGTFTSSVDFNIKITSVNDFQPVFTPATDSVNVDENSALGTPIVTKVASDSDAGPDGTLMYTIDTGPFAIDPLTGSITVSGTLDRETTTTYTLNVRAIDQGVSPSPKTGTLALTFTINDLNDNTPSCSANPFSGSIAEDAVTGVTVASLVCVDDDDDPLSQNNALTYTILNHGTDFQVDSSGVVTVVAGASLDRETTPSYEVLIDVADSATVGTKLTFTATVSVIITDINDNDPVLGTLPTPSKPENTAVGQTIASVVATDADTGVNGDLIYSITGGDPGNIFVIGSVSGVITLAKLLDFETDTSHTLQVTVTDKGAPPRSTSGNVVVTVTNVDDTAPVCGTSLYSDTLAENSVSTAVVTVTCTDVDGTISYSIIAGDTNSDFEINSSTGALATKSSANLDFETSQSHTLTIQASDGSLAATTIVQVTITDVNEFAPVFSPVGPYTKSISEAAAVGLTVIQLAATDDDTIDTVHIFSITGGNADARFTVDSSSGNVKVLAPLDRETVASYTLTVEVADLGALTDSTTLIINLSDVNDNSPSCTATSVGVVVDEGVTSGTLYTPTCTDKDTVATPTLVYSITSGTHAALSLDTSTGVLSLASAFDYETATSHSLVITVSDQNTLTTTINVEITIEPVNEFDPVFTAASTGPFSISEDAAIAAPIDQVAATDDDVGALHATIRYSIVGGDPLGQFWLDESSGQLSVLKSLDREATASYTLTIRASDDVAGSANVRTADISTVINIDDANDVTPTFNPTIYSVDVYENSTFGALVTLIQFTVSDDDAGVNGQTDISITSGNGEGKFSISGTSLTLVASLDFETTSSYQLVLEVSDRGATPLKSAARAVVNVLPINEIAPLMSSNSATASIPEDTPVGSLVYDANATDSDSGTDGQITYSIDSGVTGGEFFVDSTTGELFIGSMLDFDTAPTTYSIILKATDGGGLTATTSTVSLSITLEDVNDNYPQFTTTMFTFDVDENSAASKSIGQVVANDADVGLNGQVNYTKTGGNGQTLFDIDSSTGDVTVIGAIDFETSQVYYISMTAYDGGVPSLVSSGLVKINVNNMNDNDPVISPAEFAVSLSEDVIVGTSVHQFVATDVDTVIGVFNLAVANSFFQVDSTSGEVTTKAALDRETSDSHTVFIRVVDIQTGVDVTIRSATATLTVIVTDINDNDPVLTGTYTPSISEAAFLNQQVFQLAATDADIDENGQLVYAITAGNTGTAFRIDSNGNVQVNAGLDRETTASYTVTISATDQGTPPRSDQVDITITIDDENDNTPAFQQNPYNFNVNENSNIGDPVDSVLATDLDAGINAALTYTFDSFTVGIASHFAIDGGSGAITVASTALDREMLDAYTVNVKVTDSGNPLSLSSFTVVNIAIGDLNDNSPIFNQLNYNGSIDENSALTATILQVAATDADIGVNADLTFSLDAVSGGGPLADTYLEIDPTSGIITPKINIDYETIQGFDFLVIVTDAGVPALAGTATVTVTVNDVNDNNPVFSPVFYNAEAAYSVSCDTVITTVSATDADSGVNAQISYSLETATNGFLLNVGTSTGEIKLQSVASPNTKYTFSLRATDAGNPTLASLTSATLRLDTYVPNLHVVTFRLGISRTDFEASRTTFLTNLQTVLRTVYPLAVPRIWCVAEYSGVAQAPNRRRRLLQTSQPVDVHVISLEDDSTESIANIDASKVFLKQDALFAMLSADAAGTPGSAITGGAWTSFNIVSVGQYEEETEGWFDTLHGKVITAVAALLGVILLALWLYLVCRCCASRHGPPKSYRKRKVRISEVSPSPTPSDIRPVIVDKKPWDTNRVFPNTKPSSKTLLPDPLGRDVSPPPILQSPPPRATDDLPSRASGKSPPRPFLFTSRENSEYGIVNRDFDGRALDPVTGHVYEFNTRTNERRWLN